MNKMFRYTIFDGESGGFVLAFTKKQAIKKIKKYHEEYYRERFNIYNDVENLDIEVWLDDEFPRDWVEVF